MASAESRIAARRQYEDRMQAQQMVVADRERAMNIARFEQRTTAKIQQRMVKERVQGAQAAMADDLKRRRAKLAALLSEEDTMYEQMLQDSFESPEQRKARLFARAKELARKREERRRADVEKVQQQRWRDMSDDLRTIDSRAVEERVAQDRLKQLDEAEEARQRALEMESKYAQDWETLRAAKEARVVREAAEKKARDDEMKEMLDHQVTLRHSLDNRAKQAEEQDARKMLAMWDAEKKAEQAKALAAKRAEIEEAHRMKADNQILAEKRAIQAAKDAEEDRQRLEEALAREAAEADKEREAANARREEAIKYRKHLEAQLAIEKEEAGELDQMYLDEQERAWAKREAQWNREAEARRRLMEEVDRSRQEQIALKRALEEAERVSDQKGAVRIRQEIAEAEAEDKRRLAERVAAAKLQQEDLLNQMAIKEGIKKRMSQEEYLEYKLMQKAEAEYQARLKKMKQGGMPERDFRRKKATWYE